MKNSYRFFENRECEYYPCHKGIDHLNCLFCYCPLYSRKHCPGTHTWIEKDGVAIKNCTDCTFPHEPENYPVIMEFLKHPEK
ncbi:MAG: metal-binding protein [Agathobacter sp.]|uniref:cysteine-rich small domain-containing protein n=1 Tax=Agathobacter sp. TaxID=2021311 RepID=UPI0004E1DB2A|nr:cysteine-rich small domain-containing protein [Agathobacter sp.]MBQ1681862.1 metal-binding protein [Agathobacter sp.]MCR5676934.1 cysteine-rich small domain-containing protein [Agathobacter sp.]